MHCLSVAIIYFLTQIAETLFAIDDVHACYPPVTDHNLLWYLTGTANVVL
jgi:hypothetical protein